MLNVNPVVGELTVMVPVATVQVGCCVTLARGIDIIKSNPDLVATPPGVVTVTLPQFPVLTTAVMEVLFTTKKELAAVPPKLTAVAPVRLVPVMVTVVPLPALLGVKALIVGGSASENPKEEKRPLPCVAAITI